MSATVNHWNDAKCAKAFWSQGEMPAYQRLLSDTIARTDPRPGQDWLDIGCGCGRLTRALWHKAQGALNSVVALDLSPANDAAIARLAGELGTDRVRFRQGDISAGLPGFADASLDGVVSGLAVQYAEHYCPVRNEWTRDAYQRLLGDVCRVLRPGGAFVFSVNVPHPNWFRLSLSGLSGAFRAGRPVKYLEDTWRMLRYGAWLKQQARSGRFHYLPEGAVRDCLKGAGFLDISAAHSYAGLAFVFSARKPS
jgi:ubiquinone/menaquinone biosynthesis C-methylase UbiE